MAGAYYLIYLLKYGAPLLLTAVVAVALRYSIMSEMPARWLLAFGVAIGLSCIPVAWGQYQVKRDIAAFGPDEILPTRLELEPGALLHIQPHNHAGLTCGSACANFLSAEFVMRVGGGDPEYVFGWSSSEQLGVEDLWRAVEQPNRTKPFPYKYLFLSTDAWRVSGPGEDGTFRKPHWPENTQGVHMLLSIPPSGIVDFDNADIHYRQFNVQTEVPVYPFWGFATNTRQVPYIDDLVSGVIALQADP